MTKEQVLEVLKGNDINGISYLDILEDTVKRYVPESFGGIYSMLSNAYANDDDCSFSYAIITGALSFARDIILDTSWNLSEYYTDGVDFVQKVCDILNDILEDAKGKGLELEEEEEDF